MRKSTYFGNMEFVRQGKSWQVNLYCNDLNDNRWEITCYHPKIDEAALKAWSIYKSNNWNEYGKIKPYQETNVVYESSCVGEKSFGKITVQSKDDSYDWRSFVNFKDKKGNVQEDIRGYGKNAAEAALDVLDKYQRYHNKSNKEMIM